MKKSELRFFFMFGGAKKREGKGREFQDRSLEGGDQSSFSLSQFLFPLLYLSQLMKNVNRDFLTGEEEREKKNRYGGENGGVSIFSLNRSSPPFSSLSLSLS